MVTLVGTYAPTVAETNQALTKTSTAFDVQAGDLLIVTAATGDSANTLGTPSGSGGSITWTLVQSNVIGAYTAEYVWEGEVGASASGISISMTATASGNAQTFKVHHIRDHGGVGVSAKANAATGAPVVPLSPSPGSMVIIHSSDWNGVDGATRDTEPDGSDQLAYVFVSGFYTIYDTMRYPVPGGSQMFGLSAPVGQKWTGIAVEILPTPPVPITKIGATTNTGNATQSTTRSPTVPVGAATDDWAIIFADAWQGGTDCTASAPGFSLLAPKAISSGGGRHFVLGKKLTAADTGSYTVTFSASMWSTAHCTILRGVKPGTTPQVTNGGNATANFSNLSLTPGYSQPALLWHGYNDSAATHTPPTGFTETADVDCATDAILIATSGSTFNAAGATASVASANLAWLLAFEPGLENTGPTFNSSIFDSSIFDTGGSAPQTASVPMAQSSSMSITAAVDHPAAVGMASTSSMGVGAVVAQSAAVSHAGSSSMGVAATVDRVAAVGMAQSSAMGVSITVDRRATVTHTGSSSMGVAGQQTITAAAAMAQSSSMGVSITVTRVAAVSMAQTSTMSVSGSAIGSLSVPMVQSSTMTVAGSQSISTAVSMASTSTMAVSGFRAFTAAVGMAQSSTMAVSPAVSVVALVAMAQSSALSITGTQQVSTAVAMGQSSSLAITAAVTRVGVVGMASTSIMGVSGRQTISSLVPIASTSTMQVSVIGTQTAAVAMLQSSAMTVAGTKTIGVVVAMSQSSSLSISGRQDIPATVAMIGSSSLSITGRATITVAVAMLQSSAVAITGQPSRSYAVPMAQGSSVTITAAVTAVAMIDFQQGSSLEVVGLQLLASVIEFVQSSIMGTEGFLGVRPLLRLTVRVMPSRYDASVSPGRFAVQVAGPSRWSVSVE